MPRKCPPSEGPGKCPWGGDAGAEAGVESGTKGGREARGCVEGPRPAEGTASARPWGGSFPARLEKRWGPVWLQGHQ